MFDGLSFWIVTLLAGFSFFFLAFLLVSWNDVRSKFAYWPVIVMTSFFLCIFLYMLAVMRAVERL